MEALEPGALERLLLSSLPETLVALYDTELRCVLLDGPMVRVSGIEPARYLGRPIEQTLPPDQYAALAAPIRAALGGERASLELESEVSGLCYEVDVVPYLLADGTIAGALAICRDVTGRRERERMLAEAQATVNLGSWELDPHDGRLDWSDELCRIAGIALGTRPTTAEFMEMVHPEDRPPLEAQMEGLRAGRGGETEYRVIRPDGAVRHVHTTLLATASPNGRVRRIRGITQDVTGRVQRELEVRRLASIVEHTAEAILSKDRDGIITAWNSGAERLYGYSSEEAIGQPITIIIPPERAGEERELLDQALAGCTVLERETVRIRRDGVRVAVAITVSALRDHQGEPVGASVIARDVSERQRAERERERVLEALQIAEREARDARQRLDSIAANVPGMVYRFEMAPDGSFTLPFASAGARQIYGLEPDAVVADPGLILSGISERHRREFEASIARSAARLERWEWHGRHNLADGSSSHLRGIAQPFRRPDGTTVWDGVIFDETAVRVAERERNDALKRFRIGFERAPVGMAIAGLDARLHQVNEALCELTGATAEALCAMRPLELVAHEDRDLVRVAFERLGEDGDTIKLDHRLAHAAGIPTWVHSRITLIRDDDGRPQHTLLQVLDISERMADEQRLAHLADHDPLTELHNRRGFEAALDAHLSHCRRYGSSGALLVLDLDGFKSVNDTLGHGAGDEVLRACARRLSARLRETDTIARLGGDEFAVLLERETREGAQRVACDLIETIRGATAGLELPRPVTTSVGVVMLAGLPATREALLSAADAAMYEAKRAGKDRHAFHEPDARDPRHGESVAVGRA